MGMRINTNVQSLSAQRHLGNTKEAQQSTLEKLSSGYRINKSADDAAGLAISEKLRSEIRSTQQAERNASDGISLVQVAEGGLSEMTNMLTRIRELSIQAANDTLGEEERGYNNLEVQNLIQEIDRIAATTNFNGNSLLDGTANELAIQVGTKADRDTNQILFDPEVLNNTADNIGISGITVEDGDSALAALGVVDEAISRVNESRAQLGSFQNRLQTTINNLQISNENLSAANSRIRDADIAVQTSKLARDNILAASGVSVLSQANHNQSDALRLLS